MCIRDSPKPQTPNPKPQITKRLSANILSEQLKLFTWFFPMRILRLKVLEL
jgi:hypothetical protein